MTDKNLNRYRNVGLMAHIDAGKTTVSERFLYNTGRIHRIGETHDGDATMDWMDQEKERGITITSAATQFSYNDHTFNLIDTPGHVDFTVEVERCLRVLDGAIGVFCGVGGVESQSETVWQQAERYQVPTIAFVNKMDRAPANFAAVVQEMDEKLDTNPIPLQWPLDTGDDFGLVLDLLNEQLIRFHTEPGQKPSIESDQLSGKNQKIVNEKREMLIEAAAEADDRIFEKVIDGEALSKEELENALREGTLSGDCTPVYCGSALKNMGVQPLLDGVVDYLPSPMDRKDITGTNPETEEPVTITHEDPEENPPVAMAFKSHSSSTGDLTFLRMYQGTIETGQKVYNPRTRSMERIGRMAVLHAEDQEAVEKAQAGEIVGVVGLKETATGDTLCSRDEPVMLGSISVPETVISLAVKPEKRGARDRLTKELSAASREDPSFEVRTDQETGDVIVSGMGELHLEVVLNRIEEEKGIKIKRGQPRVSYRKTLRESADVEISHVKQSGGRGEFAECAVRFEPKNLNGEIEFEENIRGGVIPTDLIPAVEKGIREFAEDGGDEDIPLTNIHVDLYDGEHHEVDSSEVAFHTAGFKAIRKAVEESGLIVLEPIMDLEITTPDKHMGDVIEDLNTRRAEVRTVDQDGNTRTIEADVPLAEMFQFATTLRSLSEGRANYTMEFDRYAPVPEEKNREILRKRRSEKKESLTT